MDQTVYQRLITEAKTEDIMRYAVGAIIRSENRILLLHRKKDDFMGGIDEIPSGIVEENETLEEAINREVKEETDFLVQKVIDYLGYFDYYSKKGAKTRQFNFVVITNKANIVLSEHDSYRWATKDELDDSDATKEVKKVIKTYFNKYN